MSVKRGRSWRSSELPSPSIWMYLSSSRCLISTAAVTTQSHTAHPADQIATRNMLVLRCVARLVVSDLRGVVLNNVIWVGCKLTVPGYL